MYQICPKCEGQGTVSKPPWVDGDINQWYSDQAGGYECNLCKGKMFIEAPTSQPSSLADQAIECQKCKASIPNNLILCPKCFTLPSPGNSL